MTMHTTSRSTPWLDLLIAVAVVAVFIAIWVTHANPAVEIWFDAQRAAGAQHIEDVRDSTPLQQMIESSTQRLSDAILRSTGDPEMAEIELG